MPTSFLSLLRFSSLKNALSIAFSLIFLSTHTASANPMIGTETHLKPLSTAPIKAQAQLRNQAQASYERGLYGKAQRQFLRLAQAGDAWAMYNLSAMHAQGQLKTSSTQQSKQWLEKSATLGYAQAQYVLGQSFEGGQYGEKNLAKAATYYALAAQQGNAAAQIEWATALFLGRGVAKDLNLAGQWYLSAARAGEIEAQTIVARMYETGEGRDLDDRMARYWYQEAAKRGDIPSQAKLFAYEREDAKALAQ